MHAGQPQSSSPIPSFPSARAPFFFKLHFTSKSRAQLLVWVQSQETLRRMGEGSWCIFCFSLPETSLRARADPPPTPLFQQSPFLQILSQQRCRVNANQENVTTPMPTAKHDVQKEVGHQLCIPAEGIHSRGSSLLQRPWLPHRARDKLWVWRCWGRRLQ